MTAHLIDVRGDLLLPTLYPLANHAATFGREWMAAHARPAFSEYEVPFYAAKLLTAYVSAMTIRDATSSYTPTNLWHKLSHADFDALIPRVAASAPGATRVEPAEADHPPAPEVRKSNAALPAKRVSNSKLAGGAITLASVGLLSWLMFGTDHAPQGNAPKAVEPARAIAPAAKPEPVAAASEVPSVTPTVHVTAAPVTSASVAHAIDASDAPFVPRAYPAASAPIVAKATNKIARDVAVSKHTSSGAVVVAQKTSKPIALDESKAATKAMRSKASDVYPDSSRAAAKASRTTRQAGVEQVRGKRRAGETANSAQSARSAAFDRLVSIREEQAEPVRPSHRQAAPVASRDSNQAERTMSVAEMYNMLQHSPTLDDNSSLARSAPRAHALSGGNVQLSKQRVTDEPGDFMK